jgi:predicted TPR repeat methyltransferase
LRNVVRLEPALPDAYFNLGNMLMAVGQPQEAVASFRRATELRPDFAEAHVHLGMLWHSLRKTAEAESSYRAALRLRPALAEVHHHLGALLQEKQSYVEAEASFREALRYQPDYLAAWTSLGYVLRLQGRFSDATAAYRRAIQIRPDSAEIYCELAQAQRMSGRRDEAAASYRQALRINPNDVQAGFLLSALDRENAPRTAPHEYVARLFDSYADSFDATLVDRLEYRVPERIHRAVLEVIGGVPGKYDILDLGCGTGLCGVRFRDIAHRLVGVDLSPKMIEKSRERGIYDELLVSDVIETLSAPGVSYDLIVAADVFIYVGDLSAVFDACKTALRPKGLFAFSLEATEESEPFVLLPSARYAHSTGYIRGLSEVNGLKELRCEQIPIRREADAYINGHLFVLTRP